MRRDAILVVDGQEILNFGRQAIPTFVPGHRLNSGAFGTMGVGLPFGVGAKVAKPDAQVVVLHGDGSYGINANGDRHRRAPQDPRAGGHQQQRRLDRGRAVERPLPKPGPQPRLHPLRQAWPRTLGAHGEYVEKPHDIRPALERACASGKPAVVNVITDYKARAHDRALLGVHDVAGGARPWPRRSTGSASST